MPKTPVEEREESKVEAYVRKGKHTMGRYYYSPVWVRQWMALGKAEAFVLYTIATRLVLQKKKSLRTCEWRTGVEDFDWLIYAEQIPTMAPMYNHPPTRYVLLYMCISSLVSSHGYPRRDPPLIVRPYPKMRDASSHSPYITWQPAGMNGGLDYPMRKKPSPLVHDISGPVPMEDVLKEIKKPWNEPFKQPHDWEIIAGFNGTAVMDIYTPSQINSLLDQAKVSPLFVFLERYKLNRIKKYSRISLYHPANSLNL